MDSHSREKPLFAVHQPQPQAIPPMFAVHQPQPQPIPPNRMMVQPLYPAALSNPSNTPPMIPNPASVQVMSPTLRFPFNSPMAVTSRPCEPPNALPYDGSHAESQTGGVSSDSGKKKRGRPRKYSADEKNIALGLAPTAISPSGVPVDSAASQSSETRPKKARGRPPGSKKKQMDALGMGGVGFTPHVLLVNPGEDIAAKLTAFAQQGSRTVSILSAHGAVCNVTLHQPAMRAGSVTYEGRYEIISLSGSFVVCDDADGNQGRCGGMSVSLASADGQVLGGATNMLTAATTVQVIVGSFLAVNKKKGSRAEAAPSSAQPNMMLCAPALEADSSSEEASVSNESTDDNGDSPSSQAPVMYTNPIQPIHNMQAYQSWGGRHQQ